MGEMVQIDDEDDTETVEDTEENVAGEENIPEIVEGAQVQGMLLM